MNDQSTNNAKPVNCITEIAKKEDRGYIVPTDVEEALRENDPETVRRDCLAVLGGVAGFGAEDRSLCAFVAWKGEVDDDEEDDNE